MTRSVPSALGWAVLALTAASLLDATIPIAPLQSATRPGAAPAPIYYAPASSQTPSGSASVQSVSTPKWIIIWRSNGTVNADNIASVCESSFGGTGETWSNPLVKMFDNFTSLVGMIEQDRIVKKLGFPP